MLQLQCVYVYVLWLFGELQAIAICKNFCHPPKKNQCSPPWESCYSEWDLGGQKLRFTQNRGLQSAPGGGEADTVRHLSSRLEEWVWCLEG